MLDSKLLDSVRSTRMSAKGVQKRTAKLPFLFGPNYVSANCGSQLHFWSPEGFRPDIIDKELALAEELGINTLRVFLHDLHFKHDRKGFETRINEFLDITAAHKMRPMFTLFDSCWDPEPVLGHYPPPIPGKHNSRWVQSPGVTILADTKLFAALQPYVEWYVGSVVSDPRALPIADLWNEPDHGGLGTGWMEEYNRSALVAPYLLQTFQWARKINQDIMLTSGIWNGHPHPPKGHESGRNEVEIVQRACSDLPSFHSYGTPGEFAERIDWLEIDDEGNKRAVLCSEWMKRGNEPGTSNTIENLLPLQKERLMGSMIWGLFSGLTQTDIPWSGVITGIPYHDLFGHDGKLYYPAEGALIQKIMADEHFKG